MQPEKVSVIVLAAWALHNYVCHTCAVVENNGDSGPKTTDGFQQHSLVAHVEHHPRVKGSHYDAKSKHIRDVLAAYFIKQGQAPTSPLPDEVLDDDSHLSSGRAPLWLTDLVATVCETNLETR